jgi:hypothetical protein
MLLLQLVVAAHHASPAVFAKTDKPILCKWQSCLELTLHTICDFGTLRLPFLAPAGHYHIC